MNILLQLQQQFSSTKLSDYKLFLQGLSWNGSQLTTMTTENESTLGMTTVMMCLLFGTNALLYFLFQTVKTATHKPIEDAKKDKKEKELSKPFIGTLDCFYNLTIEMFRTGLIMALTYICEKHWIFDHSGKTYSRDLFMFVLIVFFAYGFYTIKPVHDLTLLSREQTEEWKGWMQFIFLLYHYFHAEEVYNSVRVMITCYVWMTGFGNFSFFYVKQDFGWLRVMQMLWRLNFSVLLLMWTHGNTWILYYICPMHTFYFLMVYVSMYLYSSVNHSKWGIRVKLMVVGIIIYIIWDINGGLFDFLFAWLGTDSVIGAGRGSVWEYYFRTSLDHWSSFLGMIFALNFPLAEQYFVKAKGWPLVIAGVLMAAASIWWFNEHYMQEKMDYNLTHSYFAIIPLTAYIFFRNITPAIRSGVSMSMHDLGKTTLETYLLQHHIWLTSNAKTLLTIVPGHPWINFALATLLFFFTSKELYRLTMSVRGMMMPDDKGITWNNCLGMAAVMALLYVLATLLYFFGATLVHIAIVCCGLFLATILVINRYARQTADNFTFQLYSQRANVVVTVLIVALAIYSAQQPVAPAESSMFSASPLSLFASKAPFQGHTAECQSAISMGHWISVKCDEPPAPALNKAAYCEASQWVWNSTACPVAKLSATKARTVFKGKRVVFAGDSILRSVYHQFNTLLDSKYTQDNSIALKHANLNFNYAASNTNVSFVWAPFVKNISAVLDGSQSGAVPRPDFFVAGAADWDALYGRDLATYSADLEALAGHAALAGAGVPNGLVTVWVQPTTVIDGRLPTEAKQKYMTEKVMQGYRSAFQSSKASTVFKTSGAVLDTAAVSAGRDGGSVDGVHYSQEVYKVLAQMCANAYSMRFAGFYSTKSTVKQQPPKPTGSMSFPSYGAFVLALSFVMLFTMDSFLGFGFLSLKLFGRSNDWESAYGPLLKKVLKEGGGGGSGGSGSRDRDSSGRTSSAAGGSSAAGQGQAEVDALLGMDSEGGGAAGGIELGKMGGASSGSSGVVVV